MGFWSRLKNAVKRAVKWVARKVKAAVRVIVRAVVFVWGLAVGLVDLLIGFIGWPPKKLRLQIFILSDGNGPVVNPGELTPSIAYAQRVLKDRFNVKLRSYSKNMVEVITKQAPDYALNVCCNFCAFKEEFDKAGEYFAEHLAGWNAIPISLTFPITVFIVNDISNKLGCSLGPLTDYVTIDIQGIKDKDPSTMMHEMGHACNLWHSGSASNLMWADVPRGDGVKWYQKNLVRSSRHVTYW